MLISIFRSLHHFAFCLLQAEACKSVGQAISKCPNGMYSEIKYDGERVQIHKQGNDFQYFSRSLKQVLPHKVAHIKDYLPQACPHGNSLILDSEVRDTVVWNLFHFHIINESVK